MSQWQALNLLILTLFFSSVAAADDPLYCGTRDFSLHTTSFTPKATGSGVTKETNPIQYKIWYNDPGNMRELYVKVSESLIQEKQLKPKDKMTLKVQWVPKRKKRSHKERILKEKNYKLVLISPPKGKKAQGYQWKAQTKNFQKDIFSMNAKDWPGEIRFRLFRQKKLICKDDIYLMIGAH